MLLFVLGHWQLGAIKKLCHCSRWRRVLPNDDQMMTMGGGGGEQKMTFDDEGVKGLDPPKRDDISCLKAPNDRECGYFSFLNQQNMPTQGWMEK